MQRTPEFATLAGNTLIPANRFRPHPAVGETFCPSGHCIATWQSFRSQPHQACLDVFTIVVMSGQTREYNDRLEEFTEERFKEDFDACKYLRETLPNIDLRQWQFWIERRFVFGWVSYASHILELCLFLIIVRFFTDQWSGRFIRERPACWEIQTQMTTRAILSSSLLRWAIYCRQRQRQRQRQR